MCRPVNCTTCGKTTWAGCGEHVDQVMAGVPAAERCRGHQNEPVSAATSNSFGATLARLFQRNG